MKMRLALLATAIAAISSPALAATQGTPGPTSTGTVTINASVTPEVNITNLDDITFTNNQLRTALNTGADATNDDDVCIWSNNVDRSYFITASGDGASNAFTLNDGTRTVPYGVTWADTGASSGGVALTSGTKSAQFTTTATATDCGGATTASLRISMTAADIATMEATTTYTGVLTLLVTPT